MGHEQKKPKMETIQSLRALSILAVLIYHTSYWAEKGDLGVHIFFVISGYLMAMILTRTGVTFESTKDFYIRRIKRIVPLYLITVFGIQISGRFLLTDEGYRRMTVDSILSILFLRNIHFDFFNISPNIHLWTVSTEIQYYLLVPAIFYFLFKMGFWRKFATILVLSAASIYLYTQLPLVTGIYFLFGRLFEFLLGSLTFFIEDHLKKANEWLCINFMQGRNEKVPLENLETQEKVQINEDRGYLRTIFSKESLFSLAALCLFTICCIYCFDMRGPVEKFDVYLIVLCAAGTILFSNLGNELLLSHRVLSYIGDLSYVLYLVHFPIYVYLSGGTLHIKFHEIRYFFYAISLTIGVSVAVHHTVETYFIKASNRMVFIFIGLMYLLIIGFITLEQLFNPRAPSLAFTYGQFIFDE